jgi:2-polyprenyl-3-methyl-5-hydroxy-6-metoxy-1,4-benzoquinol methylase
LGPVYAWMVGDLESALARGAAEISDLTLSPAPGAVAVDLGAGFGMHAIPLAQRGFSVTAIDTCRVLLEELRSRCALLPIRIIDADLLQFRSFVKDPQLIVCMGDTLTHLPALSALESLIESVAAALSRNGVFAVTFRDYARALAGDARFIPVRADAQRILTCFLEYEEHQVIVHDLLHQREDGQWRQSVSSYPKLRLAPEWLIARLGTHGFAVRRDTTPSGMVRMVATKT